MLDKEVDTWDSELTRRVDNPEHVELILSVGLVGPETLSILQKRILKHLGVFISLGLFVIALFVIFLKLRQYHLRDIITELEPIPASALAAAILLTLLNCWELTI